MVLQLVVLFAGLAKNALMVLALLVVAVHFLASLVGQVEEHPVHSLLVLVLLLIWSTWCRCAMEFFFVC